MTYITLMDDMRLVVTKADTIYRGDNLSKKITFLLPKTIGELDMQNTSVFLSYIRSDGGPDIVILERSNSVHNEDYYKYILPITCKISRYPGEVRMWLQFFSGDAPNPETLKSGDCKIRIQNSDCLDDCLGDHQITALYQLKVKVDELCNNSSGTGGSGNQNSNDGSEDGSSPEDGDGSSSDENGFPTVDF